MEGLQSIITKIHIPALPASADRFLVLILGILLLSFLINYFLSHSFLGSSYRVFVAPGVVLHELAHAFFCFITGAKVTKISFFDKNGGSVEHKASKVPILGPILISIAPLLVGAVAIYFLSRKIGLKELDLNAFVLSLGGIKNFALSVASSINYHDYYNLVIVYLVVSIAVTMTPSTQDLRNIFFSLVVIVVLGAIALHYFGGRLSGLPLPSPTPALVLLSTVSVILILSLVLSMIVYAISKMIRPTI